jgi:hypothetical protein
VPRRLISIYIWLCGNYRGLILSAGITSLFVGKEYSKRRASLMYENAYKDAVSRDEISAAIFEHEEEETRLENHPRSGLQK